VTPVPAVAIVGDQLRHRWYATVLADDPRVELRGIVSERQPPQPRGATAAEDATVADHFERRRQAEKTHLQDARGLDELGPLTLFVDRGETNEEHVVRWIDALGALLLLLYGCGIVRPPLLDRYPRRAVNIHLGLSPYYRGHATNFWPLVNGEPECVGATVHVATLEVDGGDILCQARPEMAPDDGSHDIGCKALIAGTSALLAALPAYAAGRLAAVPQAPGGRVYRHADFDAAPGRAIAELRRRLAERMIPDYLERKAERDARFPIVQ
jgi:methionyl-tRNA formyltransferase